MESMPGKDAMKIVEMTTKVLEYYINLVGKITEGFEQIDTNFGEKNVLLWIKCHETASPTTEK